MRKGWREVTLGDLIDPKRPITYGVVQPGEHDPNGIPLVRGGDFSFGWKPIEEYRRVSAEIERSFSRARLQAGDLVITIKGDVGTAAIVPSFLEGANISQTNARVAIHPSRALTDIVLALLQSPDGRRQISAVTQVGAQPGLIFRDIQGFRLSLPPLPEQRKIAEILRTWDQALEKLTALRAAKLKRHRALTVALVFGARQLNRFHTVDGFVPYRWFELPASWSCQPIGDLAVEVSERNGGGDQHEVLSCSKHDGFVRSLEYFKKQVFSTDLTGYKKIWRGDFGFPSNHVEEGSIGLQNLTNIGVVSPIYTVFRFSRAKVNAEYAFAVLKTELYRHIFEVSTSASVDRRGSLRWGDFSRLPFPVPPLAEQETITEVIKTSQSELDGVAKDIEAVALQKRGLMQKLLTGEWRVVVAEGT
ncbi:MAG: restriction endonuclease subunit S [Pseudomonadota bacterium]